MVISQDLGVHGLLLKGDSVLLVKKLVWDLPGGVVSADETLHDAFAREVKEQTGLSVENVKVLGAYTIDNGSLGLLACGMVTGDSVTLSPEYTEFQWLSIGAIQSITGASLHLQAAKKILFGTSRVVKYEEIAAS